MDTADGPGDAETAATLAEAEAVEDELTLARAKVVLDLAGLVDPTPTSDLASGLLSLSQGDVLGAGLSLVSVIPYLGDALAKPTKGARAAKKIAALQRRLAEARAKLAALRGGPTRGEAAARAVVDSKRARTAGGGSAKPCTPKSPPATKGFKTHGIGARYGLGSPEGKQLLAELRRADPTAPPKTIRRRAAVMLESGSKLPVARAATSGEKLYKVVRKGDKPGAGTPFFVNESQLKKLKTNPTKVADEMGLPNGSTSTSGYDVFEISPKPGKSPKVFESEVAPTSDAGISRPGGGSQTLVPNRADWTDPKPAGSLP